MKSLTAKMPQLNTLCWNSVHLTGQAKDAKRLKYFRIGTDDTKTIPALRQDIMMILYSVTLFDLFTL